MGDLGNKAVWASFAADKDGFVPPAILSAARDIQSMKNKFGALNLNGATRQMLNIKDSIVTVRVLCWAVLSAPAPSHPMHA